MFFAAGLWLSAAARGSSDLVIMDPGCCMPVPCIAERRLLALGMFLFGDPTNKDSDIRSPIVLVRFAIMCICVCVCVCVSKAVLLLPFSQLTLRRAAAGHVPPPAPTERRLAADGHAFSLTVGSDENLCTQRLCSACLSRSTCVCVSPLLLQ